MLRSLLQELPKTNRHFISLSEYCEGFNFKFKRDIKIVNILSWKAKFEFYEYCVLICSIHLLGGLWCENSFTNYIYCGLKYFEKMLTGNKLLVGYFCTTASVSGAVYLEVIGNSFVLCVVLVPTSCGYLHAKLRTGSTGYKVPCTLDNITVKLSLKFLLGN